MTRFAIYGVGALLFALIFLTSSIYVLARAYPSKLEPALELVASHFLKRNLEIGELVELSIGVDTFLHVEGLSLANPDWASEKKFISIKRLEARFNIPSLWQAGPILIDTLKLTGLKLDLVNPDSHSPNWDLYPENESDLTIREHHLPFLFKHGHIKHSEIIYTDPDQHILLRLKSLSIEEPGQGELLAIELEGFVNDIPVDAMGHLGPGTALLTQKDLALDLNLNWGQLEINSEGTIGDVSNLSGLNLHLGVSAPSSRALLDALGMQDIRDGPLFLEGTIIDSDPGITVDVDGRLDEFDIHLSGSLKNPKEMDGLDMKFALGGPSLHEFGAMLELHGLPKKPYKISGVVTRNGSVLSLRKGQFETGNGHMTVEATLPEFPEIDDWQATISGGGVNLALIGPLIGVDDLPVVPFDFEGKFHSNSDGVELIELRIDNSISEVRINSIVGEAPSYSGSSIELDLSGTDLASTGLWLGIHNLPSEPYTLKGKLAFSELGWQLTTTVFDIPSFNVNLSGEIEKLFEPSNITAKFQLNTPDLALVMAKFGFNNEYLSVNPLSLSGQLSGTPTNISINHVVAKSGSSRMIISGELGDPTQLSGIDLSVSLSSPDLLSFLTELKEKERPELPIEVSGNFKFSSMKLIIENLKGQIGEGDVSLSGQFNLTAPYQGSYITLDASSDHLGKVLAPWVNHELADSPFRISLKAEYEGDGIHLSHLDADLGTSKLTGQLYIDDLTSLKGTQGNLQLEGSSSQYLFGILGFDADIPDAEYSLKMELGGNSGWLQLEPISLDWGGSDISGSLHIKPGDVPGIIAKLHSNTVSLPFLFPTRDQLKQREAANDASSGVFDESVLSQQLTEQEQKERIIPDYPFDLSWMKRIQGSLVYHADELVIREDAKASTTINVSVSNGILTSQQLDWNGPFTSGSIDLRIIAQETTTDFKADIEMARVPFLLLMGGKPDHEANAFYRGRIQSTGNSMRELAHNLNGALIFKGGGGSIDNQGLDLILGDVLEEILSKLNPYSKSNETSNLICHAGALTIENGKIMLSPGLVVRTDKTDIASAGSINLHTEKLNLAFSTRSRTGIGISASKAITPYFKIGGTMTHPRLAIDVKGAVVSGSAAAATAGISIIAGGLWDRWIMTANNPCERLLTRASKNDKENFGSYLD